MLSLFAELTNCLLVLRELLPLARVERLQLQRTILTLGQFLERLGDRETLPVGRGWSAQVRGGRACS